MTQGSDDGTGENLCPDCGGSGQADGRKCPTCDGTGTVTDRTGVLPW